VSTQILFREINYLWQQQEEVTHSPQAPPTPGCLSKPVQGLVAYRKILQVLTFPEFIDGSSGWFCSDINENTDFRFDEGTERIEEPSVTVEFLLILFLQAEDDLDGTRPH
jgi:hypothetical protein